MTAGAGSYLAAAAQEQHVPKILVFAWFYRSTPVLAIQVLAWFYGVTDLEI